MPGINVFLLWIGKYGRKKSLKVLKPTKRHILVKSGRGTDGMPQIIVIVIKQFFIPKQVNTFL
jgi:hypothetical protein